jgi:hypothetical protein
MPEKPICSEIIHHEIADKNIAASDGKIHVSWKVVHSIALGIGSQHFSVSCPNNLPSLVKLRPKKQKKNKKTNKQGVQKLQLLIPYMPTCTYVVGIISLTLASNRCKILALLYEGYSSI